MNEFDRFFRSTVGVDITTMRVLTAISAVAVGVLYLYRLFTVIHCMRQPVEDFPAATDRLVWVGLAMLVPLGLGAWTYDVVRRGRLAPPLFIVPFTIVAFCFLGFTLLVWPRATKFSFDFLGL